MWITCPYCVSREKARIAKKYSKRRCRECSKVHGIEGVPEGVMFSTGRQYRLCFLHHLEHKEDP